MYLRSSGTVILWKQVFRAIDFAIYGCNLCWVEPLLPLPHARRHGSFWILGQLFATIKLGFSSFGPPVYFHWSNFH